ncbi:MAG: sigma factor-like helix-turn-helix DNA-binding protein [Eubacteriales bacterium]|nr:sigma factor-like helix-turn-helix DNA-binding protein [Eubacteriales bacterium]
MDRLVQLGQLVDWYGAFLTERQRSLVRQYAYEDCSLGEIAEREGISRQAVRDAIQTAETELLGMESKLGLIEKNEKATRLLEQLNETKLDDTQMELIRQLTELISEE